MKKILLFIFFVSLASFSHAKMKTDELTVDTITSTNNSILINKPVHISTIIWQNGSVSTGPFGGGGGPGSTAFSDLTDVNDAARAIDLVPKFNGTEIVWAPYNATFAFSIASFSDGLPSIIEIGVGTWKAVGAITFTASYNNGPATRGVVSYPIVWGMNLTNSFQGPTASAGSVPYPAVTGTRLFNLAAGKDAQSAVGAITHTFYNDRYWGVSNVATGYTSGNVTSLGGNDLVNSVGKTFTVTAGSGQYIVYAVPVRLGVVTFYVGGFEGGFNPPETVSVTNGSGFTENYYVYRSANSNLGTTTVTAQ